MRLLTVAAAAVLMLSAAAPASAVSMSSLPAAKAFSTVLPATAKKPAKKPKEKVEYMRSAS